MYLQQVGGYSDCSLYTLCNALRFYGRPSPEPGTEEWEKLIDMAAARHGTAIHVDAVAAYLGLKRTRIPVEDLADNLPADVTVWNPDAGTALHSTLLVASQGGTWTLVNYRWKAGPVVETLESSQVAMPDPGNANRRCWKIELSEEAAH